MSLPGLAILNQPRGVPEEQGVYSSDDVVRRILEVGRPLAQHGSNNWALTRAEALVAISAIERESRVLLGGDVWLASDGALSPSGDTWHYEPNPHELYLTNVKEGAAKAKAYVTAYPDRGDGVPYFELVVQ
jgi:hypothetical protein